MTYKKRRIVLILSTVVFLIMAAGALCYSQGYTLDKNFGISQKGGLYVSAPLSNSEIFINNKKKKETGMFNSGLFLSGLKTGEYSILIAKEGFWPWAKTLEIKKGLVTEARAIMVPENPKGEMLFKGKFLNIWVSPYQKLLILQEQKNGGSRLTFYLPKEKTFLTPTSAFSENLLSFKEDISNLIWEKDFLVFKSSEGIIKASFDLANSSVSASYFTEVLENTSDYEKYDKRKNEKIWWDPETNEIFIDWLKKDSNPPYYICDPLISKTNENCQLPIQIFKSHLAIKNLDFFPERKDVVVIAVGNGIYALEIDGRNGRLIYPIYKGKSPTFAVLSAEMSIYIIDDGSLIKIELE